MAKKVGSVYTEIRARLDKYERDLKKAHGQTVKSTNRIQKSINKINFAKPSASFRRFTGLFTAGLAGYGIGRIAKAALEVASSFEAMEVKLEALTDGRGKETLEELNAWALEMPVNTKKAVDGFVLMTAMGIKPSIRELQILTDVASIFGDDVLQRVALQMGQMGAKGKVMAQDLNIMAEAGINARRYLQDAFGMTVEQIQNSSIDIRDILSVIFKGMEKDFGGSAKRMMNTWRGLKAVTESYFTEISRRIMGGGIFDEIKKRLSSINTTMKEWMDNNEVFISQDLPGYIDSISNAIDGLTHSATVGGKILGTMYGAGKKMWGLDPTSRTEYNEMLKAKQKKVFWAINDLVRSNTPRKEGAIKKLVERYKELGAVIEMNKSALIDSGLNQFYKDIDAAESKLKGKGIGPSIYGTASGGGGSEVQDNSELQSRAVIQHKELMEKKLRDYIEASNAEIALEKEKSEKFIEYTTDYVDYAVESYGIMERSADHAFSSAADALANFVTTGKINFKDFTNALIADLIRMNTRFQAMKLFEMLPALFGGGGGGGGGGAPNGAWIGAGGTTAFGMASGGYLGEGVVGVGKQSGKSYEFHPNEFVMPADKVGGGGVVINFRNESGVPMTAEQSPTRFDHEKMITDIVIKRKVASRGFRDAMRA